MDGEGRNDNASGFRSPLATGGLFGGLGALSLEDHPHSVQAALVEAGASPESAARAVAYIQTKVDKREVDILQEKADFLSEHQKKMFDLMKVVTDSLSGQIEDTKLFAEEAKNKADAISPDYDKVRDELARLYRDIGELHSEKNNAIRRSDRWHGWWMVIFGAGIGVLMTWCLEQADLLPSLESIWSGTDQSMSASPSFDRNSAANQALPTEVR